MSSTIAPIYGITNDDHGGFVIVFVITAGCFSILFTIVRFGHAAKKRLGFGADDAVFTLSLVFALLQGLTIAYAVHNGLGRHTAALSDAQVVLYFKNTYVSRIFAATSIGCAKLSVAFLYKRLVIYHSWRADLIPLLSATAWMLFALFALAFQCHNPSPWLMSSSHCPTGPSLTIAVAVFSCLSDILLIVYPVWTLWQLAMPIFSRLTIVALFSARILVCVMAVIDATYAARMFSSVDPTWDHLTPVITGIVLVNLSLIIAAVPRIHSFLSRIPTGQSSMQLRSFVLPNRVNTTNTPNKEQQAPSRATGIAEIRSLQRDILNDTMVTSIKGIEEDKVSAASSCSTAQGSSSSAS